MPLRGSSLAFQKIGLIGLSRLLSVTWHSVLNLPWAACCSEECQWKVSSLSPSIGRGGIAAVASHKEQAEGGYVGLGWQGDEEGASIQQIDGWWPEEK